MPVYKRNILGEREEVPQKDIDFWCGQCQFPYGLERCKNEVLIQRCWNEPMGIGASSMSILRPASGT